MPKPLQIDFARYVDRCFIEARVTKVLRDPTLGECWEWTRSRNDRGYGHFRLIVDGRPRYPKAHRVSYQVFTGRKLGLLEGMHLCDNHSCCNPDHIVPGTHQDNMTDMKRKGRAAGHGGHSNPNARVTPNAIEEIRNARGYGSLKAVAAKYGINHVHAGRIRAGKYWPAQTAA